MSHLVSVATAATLLFTATFRENMWLCVAGYPSDTTSDSKGMVSSSASLFCRPHHRPTDRKSYDAEKVRGADRHPRLNVKNHPRVDAAPSMSSQLRGDYGYDPYGSEDSSYSTIGYVDGPGYHSNHALDYGGEWEENEVKWGGVSVSSVFQISLTVLAFLAFGGFLVNLIVQAMKDNKNNDSGGMTTMSPETLFLVPLKRPKSKRESMSEVRETMTNERDSGGDKRRQAVVGGRSEEINSLFGRISTLIEDYPYRTD